MVQITQLEYERLLAEKKHCRLSVASARKKRGGKTFYVQNDDTPALQLIAEIRNTTAKELLK